MKNKIKDFLIQNKLISAFIIIWSLFLVAFIIMLPFNALFNWVAITAIATWVLSGGVLAAIWQIGEARKSTNAQIAMDLFRELREDETVEKLQRIYHLTQSDKNQLSPIAKNNIRHILDRFEILGILVEKGIVDKDIAIHTYGGASALRCWYKLHPYIEQMSEELGPWKINYEGYTRLCLDYFINHNLPVKLCIEGKDIDILAELQEAKSKPRSWTEIKRDMKEKPVYFYPTLDACVETHAKQLYNRTSSELLKNPDDKLFQQRLETVRLFLESVDFKKLRKEWEKYLVEGKKVAFRVWQKNGKAHWKMTVNQ
ncbi:MAG: hypothetical protein JW856_03700 [Dehalococcoidales bacterium]|nr:hypothetical protein [Dehalococcoidales bacterium]